MLKLGWLSARDVGRHKLEDFIRELAATVPSEDVPDDFLVSEMSPWTSASLGGWEFAQTHRWAQAISAKSQGLVISFLAFEGLWEWRLFFSGNDVAGMEPRAAGRVFLHGDLTQASSLLEVPAEFFPAYCRTYWVPEFLQGWIAQVFLRDVGDSIRAFAGDKYAPHEEWAQLDFARRIGAPFPEPGLAAEIVVSSEKCAPPRARIWPATHRLANPVERRVWPSRSVLERFHPRNWGI